MFDHEMQNKEEKVEIPFPPDIMKRLVEMSHKSNVTPSELVESILEEKLEKMQCSK